MEKTKIKMFLLAAVLVGFLNCRLGCKVSVDDEDIGIVKVKFIFINQIRDTIIIKGYSSVEPSAFTEIGAFDSVLVLPNDTVILHQEGLNANRIEEYYAAPSGETVIIYGRSGKCDYGHDKHSGSFSYARSYEVRKVISTNNFEFTYFFTEEKKQKAGSCR